MNFCVANNLWHTYFFKHLLGQPHPLPRTKSYYEEECLSWLEHVL